ncbi:hypothetical protein RhiirC2_775020 [Rhizophagus irregularis]|uniref:F-box domain-containing protein n=1 Tax=Rhizophagus irregularis TaxID=588596 RepID=A0A2N1N7V9_9GLOM|nr:hypothetical protein RhiirC2_780252 [Rhizophagus irregularis]PKK74226.1 hypothetical protein RhiirC2_775020 [Rhizophagus irregularis]
MAYQLVDDCLNEIFEYLKKDKNTLHSCLLVNHHWCNVSVRILWKDIWSYKVIDHNRVESSILSTLFACLPSKSKKILQNNKIFISPPTSKSPLFNYPEFCKVLSINKIHKIVLNNFKPPNNNIKNKLSNNKQPLKYSRKQIVINEIIKMISNQTLKKLIHNNNKYKPNINFNYFSGLKNLSELNCNTNLPPDFFYKLSQICHNLQSISIKFYNHDVSNELKELIIMQNNLKSLTLIAFNNSSWENLLPTLTKYSNTITKLHLFNDDDYDYYLPLLSFVKSFSNLQEIIFSLLNFIDFEQLQNTKFPKLKVLKFPDQHPDSEYMIKFLENNGKNLKKFYSCQNGDTFNLSISKFCPNLKSLFISPERISILKTILENCQYLESIQIKCGPYLTKKEILETIVNYSPNNFCELKICNFVLFDYIYPKDLESFLMNWKSRVSKKLLSLIIIKSENYYNNDFEDDNENIKLIKKYESLGVIKFEIKDYKDIEKEEVDYYN